MGHPGWPGVDERGRGTGVLKLERTDVCAVPAYRVDDVGEVPRSLLTPLVDGLARLALSLINGVAGEAGCIGLGGPTVRRQRTEHRIGVLLIAGRGEAAARVVGEIEAIRGESGAAVGNSDDRIRPLWIRHDRVLDVHVRRKAQNVGCGVRGVVRERGTGDLERSASAAGEQAAALTVSVAAVVGDVAGEGAAVDRDVDCSAAGIRHSGAVRAVPRGGTSPARRVVAHGATRDAGRAEV